VPAAIHLTPEAAAGGPIARLRDGDLLVLDVRRGRLDVKLDAATLAARAPAPVSPSGEGLGRELFATLRGNLGTADRGASFLFR
jgi:phosphogluconate dehydratase